MFGFYLIWVNRDREGWDLQETVGYWKARTEVQNLAIADRARQREENEKATAEGTWTDATCEEQESGPDSELDKMEWEIKTEARRRIREDAETQGLPCFYPDGSFRKGLSGWGWVGQQQGSELARQCGPVKLYGEEGWLGAQYHSNNAGELTAVIETLGHIKQQGYQGEVMIAPDNLWAADATSGACNGKVHRRLIREAQRAHQELLKQGVTIRWGWSKGHSKLKWNEIADELANEGRASAEAGPQKEKRLSKRKTPVLQVHQIVDAIAVRRAASERKYMEEASRWVRHMIPRGDGTASVSTNYVRNNPFGRRNAEGISLQFCSRDLREQIAGQYYVEIDIRTSHPTMLRARLAALGKRVSLIDEWTLDNEACLTRKHAPDA